MPCSSRDNFADRSLCSASVERFREMNSPSLVAHKKQERRGGGGEGRAESDGGQRSEVKRARKEAWDPRSVIEGDLLSYEFDSRYYVSLVTRQ